MADPTARHFFEALGVKTDLMDRMVDIGRDLANLLKAPAGWQARLPALGWACFMGCPADLYDQAADLADGGREEEAESLLITGWNEGNRLKHHVLRVLSLGVGDDGRIAVASRRHELLSLALEDHNSARFHASIPVIFTQMEGIIRDVDLASPFSRASIADSTTLGGHPDSLPLLLDRFLTLQVHRPSLAETDEVPSRHGVLHGRSLRYDSLRNSTKSFVALFAATEIARARLDQQFQEGTLAPLDVDR